MRFSSIKVFEAAAKLFPPSCVPAHSTKNCKRTIFPFSCFQPMHRHSLLKTCSLIHESHRSRWARDQSRSSSSAAQPLTARIVLPPASLPLLSAPHVNELIWAWSLQQHRILQSATHCAQQAPRSPQPCVHFVTSLASSGGSRPFACSQVGAAVGDSPSKPQTKSSQA